MSIAIGRLGAAATHPVIAGKSDYRWSGRNPPCLLTMVQVSSLSDISRIEIPHRSSLLPYRGVLSFLSEAREASGSETARLHCATVATAAWPLAARAQQPGGTRWVAGVRDDRDLALTREADEDWGR